MRPSVVYKVAYQEWKILMACGKVEQIFGLTFDEQKLSERKILLLLHSMVQKRMLCVEADRLKPCGTYKYMLELVKASENFIAFEYTKGDERKRASLYLGEQLFWVENCSCRKETYEMTLFSRTDWQEWMMEQNVFPCYRSHEIEKHWQKIEELTEENKRCELRMCRVDTGQINRELLVYERRGKVYLVRKNKNTSAVITYHQNHLLKELESWVASCIL